MVNMVPKRFKALRPPIFPNFSLNQKGRTRCFDLKFNIYIMVVYSTMLNTGAQKSASYVKTYNHVHKLYIDHHLENFAVKFCIYTIEGEHAFINNQYENC